MIPYGKHHLDEDDIKSVVKILRSKGNITQGKTPTYFQKD